MFLPFDSKYIFWYYNERFNSAWLQQRFCQMHIKKDICLIKYLINQVFH